MKKLSRLLVLCGLGGLVALGWAWYPEGKAAALQQPVAAAPTVAQQYYPNQPALAGGCNSASCHGGLIPQTGTGIGQNEASFCQEYDQHLQAYKILLPSTTKDGNSKLKKIRERSERIAKNLATMTGGKVVPPHLNSDCLACHSTPALAGADPTAIIRKKIGDLPEINVGTLQAEGVSCQACHGAANLHPDKPNQNWLTEHIRGDQDYAQLATKGMTQIDDIVVQAKTCAACHVGAPPTNEQGIDVPARDLNHDLMAAGHPRLTFELTVFRMNEPPHWKLSRKEPNQTSRNYDARVWAIGQVASLKAQVDLTRYRAQQAIKAMEANEAKKDDEELDVVLWPELAEGNCYACHADFQEGVIDGKATIEKGFTRATLGSKYYGKREPGAPPYNNWYGFLLEPLTQYADWKAPDGTLEEYRGLKELMSSWSPDPVEVEKKAKSLSDKLDQWLTSAPKPGKLDAGTLQSVLLKWKGVDKTEMSWDEAMQWALAVAAMNSDAFRNQPVSKLRQLSAMNDLLKSLAYPAGYESPHGFGSAANEKQFQKALSDVLQRLPK